MADAMNQFIKTEIKLNKQFKRSERLGYALAKSILTRKRYNRFIRILGPGLVTGAADDDPSGIATYSQVGASFGTALLWVFPFMFPLLLAVQESCARIGAITGKGLAAVIKENYNKRLLYGAVMLVVVANVINIGADLGAMAATTQLFINLPYELLAVCYTVAIILLVVFVRYKRYAKILKWLAISLFAYPITAFLVGQDWGYVFSQTFSFDININKETMFLLVGVLGTTISPYLFFWDASEVVEEEIQKHKISSKNEVPKITKRFLYNLRLDNFVGMALASITAWFIVIACASTLNINGITEINSAADAAKALEPLVQGFPDAGLVAKLIFSVGIIGVGLLAVPVLAGSSSYAISEAMGWKEGLHKKVKKAGGFYTVIILALVAGLAINFLGFNPIKALIFAAVFNAIAAVPLLFMILKIGSSEKIMGQYKSGIISKSVVGIASVVTLLASGIFLILTVAN